MVLPASALTYFSPGCTHCWFSHLLLISACMLSTLFPLFKQWPPLSHWPLHYTFLILTHSTTLSFLPFPSPISALFFPTECITFYQATQVNYCACCGSSAPRPQPGKQELLSGSVLYPKSLKMPRTHTGSINYLLGEQINQKAKELWTFEQ